MTASGEPLSERTERRLKGLLEFARDVDEYVVSLGERNYHDHRPTQLVSEALLHRIGEAVARLPEDFVAAHPEVEWQKMKAMRNVVAHEDGFIDYHIVWRTLAEALPKDIAAIAAILNR